jgi:hypothetical protein
MTQLKPKIYELVDGLVGENAPDDFGQCLACFAVDAAARSFLEPKKPFSKSQVSGH